MSIFKRQIYIKKTFLIIFSILFLYSSNFISPAMASASGDDIICPTATPTEILIYFHGLTNQTGHDYTESLSTFNTELGQIKSQKPGTIGVHPANTSQDGSWGSVNIGTLVNEAKSKCNVSNDLPVALAGHSAGGKPIINNPTFSAWKIILLDAIYQPTSYQKTQCPNIRVIDGSTTQNYTPPLVNQCKNETGFVYQDNKTNTITHFNTRSKLSDFYLDSTFPNPNNGNNTGTGQSISLERITCELNSTTDKWEWRFKITTTNLPDNTQIYAYLNKGTTSIKTETLSVKNNYAQFVPGPILDPNTTYAVAFTVVGTSKLSASFGEKTPAEGVTTCPSLAPIVVINPVAPSVNTKTTYTPLVKLPGVPETIDTQKSDTNPCPFGNYLNILIKLFLGICGVLAVIMIVMGGIEYMTSELISSKEAGKESIRNALLGLLLALGAYLILNTINPDLLNVCLNNLPKETITIDPEKIVGDTPPPAGGKICNGEYKTGDIWPADYDTRAQLASQKIDVKLPSCSNGKVGDSCTSVYQLDTAGIIKFKQNCDKYVGGNCEVTISGGTECWMHGSNPAKVHMPGGFSADIRKGTTTPTTTPNLIKYITQDGKNTPTPVKWIGGAYYPAYAIGTLKVVDEKDHYHVVSY